MSDLELLQYGVELAGRVVLLMKPIIFILLGALPIIAGVSWGINSIFSLFRRDRTR